MAVTFSQLKLFQQTRASYRFNGSSEPWRYLSQCPTVNARLRWCQNQGQGQVLPSPDAEPLPLTKREFQNWPISSLRRCDAARADLKRRRFLLRTTVFPVFRTFHRPGNGEIWQVMACFPAL
eukprot:s5274_g3.t1